MGVGTRATAVIASEAKQSMEAKKEEWIASSLALLATTGDTYIPSNNCLTIIVIRPFGESSPSMMVKWLALLISS